MTKLIVQIPCLNEEETLPATLKDIPGEIEGIDVIEILVIDDGSTDRTAAVARERGVDHIIRFKRGKGLGAAFGAGLDASLRLGADIVVNTDGDNQYKGADIRKLVRPILNREAEIVIGTRNIDAIKHFSFSKKKLQKLGSWVVRCLSGINVRDATSGFRAYSREAALQLNVLSTYTYTLETLIQAGRKGLAVRSVEVGTNEKLRESRLLKSIPQYLMHSASTLIRIFTLYNPIKVFSWTGGAVFFLGVVLGLRYLYLQFFGKEGVEHFASLILCAIFLIMGFNLLMIALLADLVGANRGLIEKVLLRMKKLGMESGEKEPGDEVTSDSDPSLQQ